MADAEPEETTRGFPDVDSVRVAMATRGYLAGDDLATAIFLALRMRRPLLLEGEAGVGKTEVAKTLAAVLSAELVRLQCYEGIDAAQALYDWDYARQLLAARIAGDSGATTRLESLYTEAFLLERPVLKALRAGADAVLLVDELDRADDEFEAFLLEVLSDYSLTIPELGTVGATEPPLVVITSNRTRDLHDALKRRCLYHWVEFPDPAREVEIITTRLPGVSAVLARSVAHAVARIRELDVVKRPGTAEALDWTVALTELGSDDLTVANAARTLGAVVKNREDVTLVGARLPDLLDG